MNQFQWTFLDNKQQRHTLGIAHSAKSGHLVVHCDHRVVLIDFGVLEERTFSFFIEEELCKLTILGSKAEGFTYDFNIDTEIDTATNRIRKKKKRSERFKSGSRLAVLLGGTLAIVLGVAWWGYSSRMERLPYSLRVDGIQAKGEFLEDGRLEFIAGNNVVKGRPVGNDLARLNRISFSAGDKLSILFDGFNNDKFIIDWPNSLKILEDELQPENAIGTLLDVMSLELPTSAGSPRCALLTAEKIGGPWSVIGLIDAFLLEKQVELEKWQKRFTESAYQNRIQQLCPTSKKVLSPEI